MDEAQKKLILFMPSMEGGGVEKNIILIANYLSKFINYITIITYNSKFNNKFNKNIKIINGSKKKNYKSKYYKYFICILILIQQLLKNRNALVFSFQANIYALFICILLRKKIIVRSNSSPSGWTQSNIKNLIFKKFLKLSNCIIVNSSQFQKEMIKKFNVNPLLIYNPLNKEEILNKSVEIIKFDFFKSKKILNIINVARFTDQKDHLTLLKGFYIASKKIRAKLVIMGYGSNLKVIKSYIKNKKISKIVKVLNFHENPYPYIKKSDLFILSSRYEGLPNVLLEAMTLKKFIISTDCPTGPREILKNGKYGNLFKIGDYADLSRLIVEFYENKKKYKKKTKLAYDDLKRFDYNKNCQKYLRAIQNAYK